MTVSDVSTATIFGVSFLGTLFAILATLLLAYTYVTLRLIPKLKLSFRALVEEIGPRALFERANLDPAETMQQLGIAPTVGPLATQPVDELERIGYTCEDHGRCVGCLKVLAQFEAIVRHQGEASFDEIERRCFEQLKAQLASDARSVGETETDRQQRIAARVIETLVREGFSPSHVRGVVWAVSKDNRASFASWLVIARACAQIGIGKNAKKIEEHDA